MVFESLVTTAGCLSGSNYILLTRTPLLSHVGWCFSGTGLCYAYRTIYNILLWTLYLIMICDNMLTSAVFCHSKLYMLIKILFVFNVFYQSILLCLKSYCDNEVNISIVHYWNPCKNLHVGYSFLTFFHQFFLPWKLQRVDKWMTK